MRVLTGIELRTVSGGAMAARPVNLRPVVRELEELIVLVRILVKDLGGRGMTPPVHKPHSSTLRMSVSRRAGQSRPFLIRPSAFGFGLPSLWRKSKSLA